MRRFILVCNILVKCLLDIVIEFGIFRERKEYIIWILIIIESFNCFERKCIKNMVMGLENNISLNVLKI